MKWWIGNSDTDPLSPPKHDTVLHAAAGTFDTRGHRVEGCPGCDWHNDPLHNVEFPDREEEASDDE